jgi:hypothetical protein
MGSTAQRPSPATTSDFWYNTTNELELYNGSDWFFVSPWKQSTSSSNVFLNSGSAIVNSSSILNSNYKFQVNGGALYSGATFTSNQTNQAALDIRQLNLTAQSGTTHALWGINIEGAMTFNTFNQTYGGLRISTTSNATANQSVIPIDITYSAAVLGGGQIINTNTSNGSNWLVGGGGSGAPERITIRSPNGATGGAAVPGITYRATSAGFGWGISGRNNGLVILSNEAGINPNDVDPTVIVRADKVLIGRRPATTPTATLEITGIGTSGGTSSFLVQNSSRSNSAFRILDNATGIFGGKMMVGLDSSFLHNPTVDTTYFRGNARIQAGNLTIEKVSGTPYLNIIAKASSGNQEAGIYLKSRANFSPIIEFDVMSGAEAGKQLPFYNYNTARGGQQVFVIGAGNGRFGAKSVGQFFVVDSLDAIRRFAFNSNGTANFDSYGIGTKEAADLSKTQSNYIAGFATDGTVLDVPINTELYNTVTSTTSPVTLSSTIADNLINQGSTQATFTFRLPASPVDGQIAKATFANAVTALTIDGNGTTVTGTLPTTAAVGQQIVFKNYTGLGWVRQL